jgi:predicted transcriptional regulator
MSMNKAVKLDDAIYDRLKALGNARDRTPHWLMKTAIVEYVEREEAYEREKNEDMERLAEYEKTGYAISNEIASKWLASVGTDCELPCPK